MNKNSNTFAGLEALPADIMDKITRDYKGPEVVAIKPAPMPYGSWSELAELAAQEGLLSSPPAYKVVFSSDSYGGVEYFKTTVGEILQQAHLERSKLAEELSLEDVQYLRHLVSSGPLAKNFELLGKLDRLIQKLCQKGRTTIKF